MIRDLRSRRAAAASALALAVLASGCAVANDGATEAGSPSSPPVSASTAPAPSPSSAPPTSPSASPSTAASSPSSAPATSISGSPAPTTALPSLPSVSGSAAPSGAPSPQHSVVGTDLVKPLDADSARWTLWNLPLKTNLPEDEAHVFVFPGDKPASDLGWVVASPKSKTRFLSSCTAMDALLIREGEDVQYGEDCKVTKGVWTDPFTGRVTKDPKDVVPFYVLPDQAVWRSGGSEWAQSKQTAYLAGPRSLTISVNKKNVEEAGRTLSELRAGRDVTEWVPGNGCAYAAAWVDAKDTYDLALTSKTERDALDSVLRSCEGESQDG